MPIFHGLFAMKFPDWRETIAMQGGRKRFAESLLCDIQ